MVQLDTREIMDGILATLYEGEDAIEPPFAAGNSERDAWFKSQITEAHDIGQIESAIPVVVGDVKEDCVRANARRHSIPSLPARFFSHWERCRGVSPRYPM
jgi:hypothetical protein